jgi:hypothetical protein
MMGLKISDFGFTIYDFGFTISDCLVIMPNPQSLVSFSQIDISAYATDCEFKSASVK